MRRRDLAWRHEFRRRWESGEPADVISREMEISVGGVYYLRERLALEPRGNRWTPERENDLVQRWSIGERVKTLVHSLGMSSKSIQKRRRVLGLPTRRFKCSPERRSVSVLMTVELYAAALSRAGGAGLSEYVRSLIRSDISSQEKKS